MKILNIIPYSPVPAVFGGALRVYHLLRWMTRHHEVTVLSYGTPDDPARIEADLGHPASRTIMVPEPRTVAAVVGLGLAAWCGARRLRRAAHIRGA